MGKHHILDVHDVDMGMSSKEETQQQRELAEKLRQYLEALFTKPASTEVN